MQGIVFVYEKKRSFISRMVTVRIEERKKVGSDWIPPATKRCYRARDLQGPGVRFVDKKAFSMIFRAESELRKQEARFFSLDADYTLLRVSPHDLKEFLGRCNTLGILCSQGGRPLGFTYAQQAALEIGFRDSGNGFVPGVSISGKALPDQAFCVPATPARIVSGLTVYEVAGGVPSTIVQQLISGEAIPYDRFEDFLKTLTPYAEHHQILLPGKKPKEVICDAAVTPVLDMDPSFRFANLGFLYEGSALLFSMGDKRSVVFDIENNIELHRDFDKESDWRKRFEQFGAIYRAATRGDWFIPDAGREKILYDSKRAGFQIRLSGAPLILDISAGWEIRAIDRSIAVGGSIRFGKDETDMETIMDAYLSAQRWFDLPGGVRGYIPESLWQKFRQLEQRGDFRDDDIRFEQHDFSFVEAVFQDKETVRRDDTVEALRGFLDNIHGGQSTVHVPEALNAQLRPYQRTGYSWLAGLMRFGFGGILADDMGLGKTLQVLTLLLHLKETRAGRHVTLLVVPKTLIWNWESEIRKFAPSLSARIHSGSGRDTVFPDLSAVDLVITSYGLARQDVGLLGRVSWDLIVLDEAQAIKNPDSQVSGSLKALKSSNRLALTGTPIENRPLDLWSLFDFLMPGLLGDRASFQEAYGRQDSKSLELLRVLIAPFVLRRMKTQVCKELPPKTEITQLCEFTDDQKACYDEILSTGKGQVFGKPEPESSGESRPLQILTLLLRLRQAACHPALAVGTAAYPGGSGKLEAIGETALEIIDAGYNILIFSQFVAHLEIVKEMLGAHGVEQHFMYGSTRNREEVIDRFKGSKNPCVFLISLKTGGVGLNLTEAGYVFLLDPWWNPAIENQAIDRSYRIGQENPVMVYRFITKNSVEEKVSLLKKRKRQVEKAVLAQDDIGPPPFSEKELADLISIG